MTENQDGKNNIKELRKIFFIDIQKVLEKNNSKLYLYFRNNFNNPFEVKFVDGNPEIILNKSQINDFNSINFDGISNSISKDKQFESSYKAVKEAINSGDSSINLHYMCCGFIGPFFSKARTTHHYNPYVEFKFKNSDLKEIFPEEFKDLDDNDFILINKATIKYSNLEENELNNEENELNNDDSEVNNRLPRNKIFFGPPGTGKSHQMLEEAKRIRIESDEFVIRTTFHPEFSYYDFIGQYKPVVGYEIVENEIFDYSNNKLLKDEKYKKPIVYYEFVSGAFTKAVIKALQNEKQNILLIIEEINRGNCAAIFGDIFQLLDRENNVFNNNYGSSKYAINISDDMKNHIIKNISDDNKFMKKHISNGFKIPKNLFIYATMNTSDQSLFPMDSAFKRRWDMEYIGIEYRNIRELKNVFLPKPYENIKWLHFIKETNKRIVEFTQTDDKQIGQWFSGYESKDNEKVNIYKNDFISKILSYLWFDVFRHEPSEYFKDDIKTYDDICSKYDNGVLKEDIIKEIFKIEKKSNE